MARFRRAYGAGPLHLIGFLASLGVCALAIRRVFDSDPTNTREVIVWFVAAVVVHDLIFLPAYSLVDRGLRPLGAWSTYLRVPALLSGLLLLVFFPLILHRGSGDYFNATSLNEDPYLARWLIATGVLFGVSLLVAGTRAARRRRPRVAPRVTRSPPTPAAEITHAAAAKEASAPESPPPLRTTTAEDDL